MPPLFPFGFGLSYTKWRYHPTIRWESATSTATVTLTNIGTITSDHVILLFARRIPDSNTHSNPLPNRYPSAESRVHPHSLAESALDFGTSPKQSLVGFKRVQEVAPGRSVTVSFALDRATAFALVDVHGHTHYPNSWWELFVGPDVVTRAVIEV